MTSRRAGSRSSALASCILALMVVLASCTIERDPARAERATTPSAASATRDGGVDRSIAAQTTSTAAPRELVKIEAPCTRDGDARPGGTAIVAVWEHTVALACGALLDATSGRRVGWLEPSGVVTLANGTVLGWRDVAKTADQPAGREYVTVDATGHAGAVWGVLPRDLLNDANVSWFPVGERGVFVGLHRPAWSERSRASAVSMSSNQPTALHVYDTETGTHRVVDPVKQFAMERNDVVRWWVVDGQLLLSSLKRGVTGLRASDLAVAWTVSPELLMGTLVEAALDYGRLGVLAVRRTAADDNVGLDVRSGSVLLSPRATSLVHGTVQVPATGDYAVLHDLQLSVSAAGASAVRDGQKLWTTPDVKGPCDFAAVPPAQPNGLFMTCGGFVVFQRA